MQPHGNSASIAMKISESATFVSVMAFLPPCTVYFKQEGVQSGHFQFGFGRLALRVDPAGEHGRIFRRQHRHRLEPAADFDALTFERIERNAGGADRAPIGRAKNGSRLRCKAWR